MKYDLKDTTFIIPVRIDSMIRLENLLLTLDSLESNLDTNIIIIEASYYNNGLLKQLISNHIVHYFVEDKDPVFHRTKHLNTVSKRVNTDITGIWDADIILESAQIIEAILQLRSKNCDIAYPYKGSYPNHQKASIEHWKIDNDFDILRRIGNKIFTFRSNNEYASKPQSLEITKNDLLSARENIGLSSFYSVNSLDYSIKIGKIRIGMPTEVLYKYRQIGNERDGVTNHLSVHKLKLSSAPSAEYYFSDFHFDVSVPLFYQVLSLDRRSHQFYGVNPSLSMSWIASSMVTLRAFTSYSNDLPDENLFYPDTILNDYRNITAGYIDFSTGKSADFSTTVEYKDVIKTLFANLRIALSNKHLTKMPGQDFEGELILNDFYLKNWTSTALSVSGSLSKGIELINGIFAIYPLYVHNKSRILRNGIILPYSSDSYSLRGRITSRIAGKCNLTYQMSYSYNKNKMEASRTYFSSVRLSESLKATWSPIKSLQLSYMLDHYCNELTTNNYKNFIFSDVSASYLLGNRWELACYVKNMFNEKSYSCFIENELASFYQSYKIRPRNVLLSATYRF